MRDLALCSHTYGQNYHWLSPSRFAAHGNPAIQSRVREAMGTADEQNTNQGDVLERFVDSRSARKPSVVQQLSNIQIRQC